MSPADIVKVRLQCQTQLYRGSDPKSRPKYRGPVHCLLTIAREEGLLGLYKGAGALALRDGPSFATYFLVYNTVCDSLTSDKKAQPGKRSLAAFNCYCVETLNSRTNQSVHNVKINSTIV